MIHSQTFDWTPKAKARPRVTKTGHAYTEPATRIAEAALAEQYGGPCFEGPVNVSIQFSDTQVFWTIEDCDDYLNRKLRGDTDNYIKLATDALNGIAYRDDKQIVTVLGRKL